MSRINFRLLFIHFFAVWFFMYAVKVLAFLYDTDILEAISDHDGEIFNAQNFSGFYTVTTLSVLAGLLAGFLISLFISIRKGWFWINSVAVFLTLLLLIRLDMSGWKYLKTIFLLPGNIFEKSSVKMLVNGIVFLIISMALFFLRKIQRYISGAPAEQADPTSSFS